MPYTGTVPQGWVDWLAPHLNKANNGGQVMAEQLLRDEYTRDALVKMFSGQRLSADDKRRIPISINGGSVADHFNAGGEPGEDQ